MKTITEDNWEVLNHALRKLWEGTYHYSKKVKVSFNGKGTDEIGIFTTGIDNCYNKERGWRWEIFLNRDGTWRLN